MCGIVGYVGDGNAEELVLEGLRRLEYRGYDSAGISRLDTKKEILETIKAVGKIENLEKELLKFSAFKSPLAIGHTRWATHGIVNETNAHPHGDRDVCIVHNGIIENAYQLRDSLKAQGVEFQSETDTEVFYQILNLELKKTKNIKNAILNSFQKVEGNSAFVVIHKEQKKLYAIKRSAPLVCAKRVASGSTDLFVSSDPYALLGFVDVMFFPEDEVLCELSYDSQFVNFYELDGSESERYRFDKKTSAMNIETKGSFDHFMLKEIHEQPHLIKNIMRIYKDEETQNKILNLKHLKSQYINIIGCGTAWHAGLVLKNALEAKLPLKANCEIASEYRYRKLKNQEIETGLFISQSGETADTLACTEMMKSLGHNLISILNVEGSSIYRECSNNFLIHAGQEVGVASTKAFTMQVIVGHFLIQGLMGKDPSKEYEKELITLSERVEDILAREDEIKEVAKDIYQKKGFIFTGRGKYFPIALEGALKLKEIAYVHAEGYAAGELKHGPIALIDENMVNVSLIGPELYDKTLSNTEEVRSRRGKILIVGPKDKKELKEISDWYIPLNFDGLDDFAPLYVNVVMQLLSYYIAKEKGTDIDKPRNLAKSVTVE